MERDEGPLGLDATSGCSVAPRWEATSGRSEEDPPLGLDARSGWDRGCSVVLPGGRAHVGELRATPLLGAEGPLEAEGPQEAHWKPQTRASSFFHKPDNHAVS